MAALALDVPLGRIDLDFRWVVRRKHKTIRHQNLPNRLIM